MHTETYAKSVPLGGTIRAEPGAILTCLETMLRDSWPELTRKGHPSKVTLIVDVECPDVPPVGSPPGPYT